VSLFIPKRRYIKLFANLARVTRNPVNAYRSTKVGRLAIRRGAIQKLSELAPFLAFIGHPRVIVEIGAGEGGMLAAFCAIGTDDATIISIDLEGGPFGDGASDAVLLSRANAKQGQSLHLVRGDSRDPDIIDRVTRLTPDGIDLLFIDGDHTYEGVSADYRLYSPLVSQGGIIALHDILPHSQMPECQVDRFWSQLKGTKKREIIAPGELRVFSTLAVAGTWGGIGVLVV
jgi:cephalosporin hydroxylase